MFYLNFLKDKYTHLHENHYRIHEEHQTILPKKHPSNTKRGKWKKKRIL